MITGKPALLDRRNECALLDRVLAAARGGSGAVLVVRGEPGIGKTALLEHAVNQAQGVRVARVAGVESEMELAFAALQQLCGPMLNRLPALPRPQQDALATVFGRTAGSTPDRLVVGLAVLSLLSDAGRQHPLVCVIDDAQWLDHASAQALAFAARRLQADAVAMIFGTREQSEELTGMPELLVSGLGAGDSCALLDWVAGGRMDERVRDQIVMEAHGNPLALMELPRGSTPADLAGGFRIPDVAGLPGRLERSFRRRYEALPALTRQLLLVAAAETTGDPALVWEAAGRLGIGPDAALAAEADGLVMFGTRVVFRHPLVRSAVYRASSPGARRAVHQALARSIDARLDPDRRAWHRAQAALGPDEDVAGELESSAAQAQARGGYAAAAAFLERSALLTRDPARRAARALAAAQAKQQAGAFDAALGLLVMASDGPLSALQRAQVDVLRGRIAWAVNRGSDAPPFFVNAARQFQPLDATLARNAYLEALGAAILAADLAMNGRASEVAHAVLTAPAPDKSPTPSQLLLDGFALLISQGHAAGAPTLEKALSVFRGGYGDEDELHWFWLACHAAGILWEDQTWHWLTNRFVELARRAGALSTLPLALSTRAASLLFCGELDAAASLADQADAINDATGGAIAPYVRIALAAFYGREAEALRVMQAATQDVIRRGEGAGLTIGHWAAALLYNGAARYEDALAAARRAADASDEQFLHSWGLVELVEASARTGRQEDGANALRRLTETVSASATDWGLGVEARSKALLAAGHSAEAWYKEAIDRLERTRMRVDLARSCLAYGEWLRRERRRLDARRQLRRAYELFAEFGMEAFADRTRAELEATGEHPQRRIREARDDLTPQEAQISRLAADGATNAEIAARLFISASTVDYHLRKVFRKLAVRSRTQLARRLRADSLGV